MEISVEISKYPLTESYLEAVDDFLYRLHSYEQIQVQTNNISTQIFGEAHEVFSILQKEITRSFENGQAPFVLKILKGNLAHIPVKDYK